MNTAGYLHCKVSCLQVSQMITVLRLTHNNIPDEGVCSLVHMLGENKLVTELVGGSVGAGGVIAYGIGLQRSAVKRGAVRLAPSRQIHAPIHLHINDSGIRVLLPQDLSGNRIVGPGSKALAALLSTRGTILRSLNLSHMRLADKVCSCAWCIWRGASKALGPCVTHC